MDLLQTVRKEGSRGGVNFSWDDVRSSTHRENYLGHSLMAPVGRWQKGKDLNWYAKAEDAELPAEERKEKEELERKEERRKVKEAEEDAMARALGLPVPDRSANAEPLGLSREAGKALKEALGDGSEEEEKVGLGKGERKSGRKDEGRDGEGGRGGTGIMGGMSGRVPSRGSGMGIGGAGRGVGMAPSHDASETTAIGRGTDQATADGEEAKAGRAPLTGEMGGSDE